MDEYKKCMYNEYYIYMYVYIYLRDQKTVNTDIFDIFGVCVFENWCTANSHGLGYRIIDSWPHPSTDLTLDAPLVDPEINKSTPKKCDLLKKGWFLRKSCTTMWGPQDSYSKLVYNSNNYGLWYL